MRRFMLISALLAFVMSASAPQAQAAEDAPNELQGTWVAKSMEADGKTAPAEQVKRMRFTFKGDKLLVKGNFDDDREDDCVLTINSETSPKQLQFTLPKEPKPILGIYEVNEGELKICFRHGSSSEGRPTEFATKPETQLVLIVFKKQAQ